jgi:hypothetical protein
MLIVTLLLPSAIVLTVVMLNAIVLSLPLGPGIKRYSTKVGSTKS